MEDEMASMFPNGKRTLVVDDDAKFLNSATRLLSSLNFIVIVCSNITSALKSLMSGGLKGFDVILVHAAKAAACGFDFRAIIEANLLIPVIYFLPQDHKATGADEADELLRVLQAGTYIIKKPVDANEVRIILWKVITHRKCELETKARRGIGGDVAGLDIAGEDKDRIDFKVLKGTCRKRKGCGSNPGDSSVGTTAAAGGHHPAAKGEEKDNAASQQQPAQQKHGRGKKTQKNGGGEGFKLLQPNKAMMNGPQLNQHLQPESSLFVHPVFGTLGMLLPYNKSKFFSDAAGESSNASAGNNASALPASRHHVYSAAPSPLPPAAHNIVFGNNMPPATAPAMAAAATATYESMFSQVIGNQQPPNVHSLPMFGPFQYQAPPPPPSVMRQDVLALAAAGDLFTGGMAGGASAAVATDAVAYGNDVSLTFLQPPNLGAEKDLSSAIDSATMEWLLSDDLDDYIGGSPAPAVAANNQVLGKASNVDEPKTMAPGGAFGSTSTYGSVIGSQGNKGDGAVMDGDDAMLPSDQNKDSTPFPLADEALLDALRGPIFEFDDIFDLDAMLGGLTGGGVAAAAAAADDDDAGASLIAGEEGDNINGLGNLDGLQIPYDLLDDFLF